MNSDTFGWSPRGVRSGHMSLDEWDGHWRASESDTPPTGEEYCSAYEALTAWLHGFARVGCSREDDCYVRGDNYGDRTQYLEICHSSILTVELLGRLQDFLRQPQYSHWRIFVMTYLERDEIPVVYPDAVRLGRRLEGRPLADAIADIRSRMPATP